MARSQFPCENSDLFGIDLVCGHYIIGELDSLVEALVKCLGYLSGGCGSLAVYAILFILFLCY